MDNINEQILIEHLSNPQTKHKAFETIVKMYGEQLYWNVRRIVLTHEDANDVVQNVFIKAWNSLDSFRNESKIYTWLYRISVNESLDFMRKQKTQNQLYSDNSPVADNLLADKYFDGSRAEALLQAAIAQLPDVQRLVFNMRYYDDMKYSEMSKILDTTEGALKASYHIAVKKISEYLKNHD